MYRYILDQKGRLYREDSNIVLLEGDFRKAICQEILSTTNIVSPIISVMPTGSLRFILPYHGSIRYAIVKLTHLNFHAPWSVRQEGENTILFPSVHQPGSAYNPITDNKNLLWRVPEFLPTYFVYDITTQSCSMVSFAKITNAKTDKQEIVMRRLPVPNQWDDTRLCYKLPTDTKMPAMKSITDRVQYVFDAWVNSIWNIDLYNEMFTSVFKWNADGVQIEMLKEKIMDYTCPPIAIPKDLEQVYSILSEQTVMYDLI